MPAIRRFPVRARVIPLAVAMLTLLAPACDQASTETAGPAPEPAPAAPTTPAATPTTPAATPTDGSPIVYPTGSIEIRAGETAVYADPGDIDFGITRPGTKLRAEFRLVNPTDLPIKVLAAKPTCQCTTVQVDGEVIPPRGALGIPATLQVPNTTGRKQAAINTALAPGVSGPRLTLKTVAAYAVRTDPLYVDALTPEGLVGTVTLDSTDGRPFQIRSVNLDEWSLQTPDAPAMRHVVTYDLTGENQDTMPKWLLFETDHPEAAMIEMRVRNRWSMLPHQYPGYEVAIQFDGYIANLGAVPAGEPSTFSLELKQFAGQRVLKLTSGDPGFTAELLDQVPGDDGRVRITGSLTPAAGTTGTFMVPVTFEATTGSETLYAIGVVR